MKKNRDFHHSHFLQLLQPDGLPLHPQPARSELQERAGGGERTENQTVRGQTIQRGGGELQTQKDDGDHLPATHLRRDGQRSREQFRQRRGTTERTSIQNLTLGNRIIHTKSEKTTT